MKYFYLFILITGITGGVREGRIIDESEVNTEQGIQIDCLITTDQDEEKAVIKKANGLAANTPYYIGEMFDEVTPMAVSNQFVKPVHKFGIPGKEPEYLCYNESPRLGLLTSENQKAVILNRIQKVGNRL